MPGQKAGIPIIPVVAREICPPRICGGRGDFENSEGACNTSNQRILGVSPTPKAGWGEARGRGVIPAQQLGALAGGLSSTDQNRPVKSCPAGLVYSTCILLAKIRVTWCPSVSKGSRSESAENGLESHF